MNRRVAIVGAGISGLSCAHTLAAAGTPVCLYDKGRRPGGRMASTGASADGIAFAFDYGAQYLTARHPDFIATVDGWAKRGLAARWPAAGPDAWVGLPDMASPVAALAAGLAVGWSHHVTALLRRDGGWYVRHQHGEDGPFATLVLAMPPEQAAVLAGPHDFALAQAAARARSAPCWSTMLGFAAALPVAGDVVVGEGALSWAARNVAKPGRSGGEAWVIHADPAWSRAHLEQDAEAVAGTMARAFLDSLETDATPVFARAHRWRYALTSRGTQGFYHDPASGLGACGDWLLAPRIESAWLSGRMLARSLGAV
jgi:predicted NAD/FAD-dependent oxidoreductase